MSTGKVRTLFTDKTQTEALYPKTKISAISDNNGVGLEAILNNMVVADGDFSQSASEIINADTLQGHFAEEFATNARVDAIESSIPATAADIGAAPIGRLDANYEVATDAELDAIIEELTYAQQNETDAAYGFYMNYTSGNNFPTGRAVVTIHKSVTSAAITAVSFYDNRVLHLQKEWINGTWSEWEWENPPMNPGHSYRTTEKLNNGKAVYSRFVNCGEAANGKKTTISGTGDISIIRYDGTIGGRSLPYIYETMDNAMSAWVCISKYSIYLFCGSSQVGNNYSVQIWYTKDNE